MARSEADRGTRPRRLQRARADDVGRRFIERGTLWRGENGKLERERSEIETGTGTSMATMVVMEMEGDAARVVYQESRQNQGRDRDAPC